MRSMASNNYVYSQCNQTVDEYSKHESAKA